LAPTCIEGSGGSQNGIVVIPCPLNAQSLVATFCNGGSLFGIVGPHQALSPH